MKLLRIVYGWRCSAMIIGVVCFVIGCVTSRSPSNRGPAKPKTNEPQAAMPAPIMTTPARVAVVNRPHSFVVIDFGARRVLPVGFRAEVYRGMARVGAVRITEPVRGRFAAADVLEGELKSGDEVR